MLMLVAIPAGVIFVALLVSYVLSWTDISARNNLKKEFPTHKTKLKLDWLRFGLGGNGGNDSNM